MKQIITVIFLIAIMALVACSSGAGLETERLPEPPAATPAAQPTPMPEYAPVEYEAEEVVLSPGESVPVDIPSGKVGSVISSQTLSVNVEGFPGVSEGFGLYGATVTITNVYPGWSGSAPITIVNGNDHARTFQLSLQQPGIGVLQRGYEPFPKEYFSWINIENMQPRAAIGGTVRVSVTLSSPFNFPRELKGKKYDLRILVEDWSQTGFIQLALQEKWLIEFWDGIEVEE